MAYNNRIPPLSRIDKSVRDTDFISIVELKEFDELLTKILERFSTSNTRTESEDELLSVGQQLKNIQYNIADALVLDDDGNIIDYREVTDPYSNQIVAEQGSEALNRMISDLESYYDNFIRLMGGDSTIDNWRYDLEIKFTEAMNNFNNKINSIFGRTANAAALEAKENENYNYISKPAVRLDDKSIVRLNPDLTSYTRNITVSPKEFGSEIVIFEALELETDSLALNLKIQNGGMYYNINFIVDNGVVHISKEEYIKLKEYGVVINVYKFTNKFDENRYVFTLIADNFDLNESYNFEITGLLVASYNFDTSGFKLETHKDYYYYKLVEDTSVKPEYDFTYYTMSQNVHTEGATENELEEELLTVYSPHVNLKVFLDGVDYYTKETDFVQLIDIELDDDLHDGLKLDSNLNQNNEKYVQTEHPTIVDDKKYTSTLKVKRIDIDSRELMGEVSSAENKTLTTDLCRPDTSKRFYTTGNGAIHEVRDSANYINGNINVAYGKHFIELSILNPSEAVMISPFILENQLTFEDLNSVDSAPPESKTYNFNEYDHFELEMRARTLTNGSVLKFASGVIPKHALMSSTKIFSELLYINDIPLDSFGNILSDNLKFVGFIEICPEIIQISPDFIDIRIYCDTNNTYETCTHIYVNIGNEPVVYPRYKQIMCNGGGEFDGVISSIRDLGQEEKTSLVAGTSNGQIIYNRFDNVYTPNALDQGRDLFYKSFKTNDNNTVTFGYGSGSGTTYITNRKDGDVKNFNYEVNDVVQISHNRDIYLLPGGNLTGLYRFVDDPTGGNIIIDSPILEDDLNEIDINDYMCDEIHETSQGIFIKATDTNHNRCILFAEHIDYNDTVTTGNNHQLYQNLKLLLSVEEIDCIAIINDEPVISAFHSQAQSNLKWLYDRENCEFKSIVTQDINHNYSFNKIISHNGELFILNGTGYRSSIEDAQGNKLYNFQKGVCKLYQNYTNLSSESNGFWDIRLLREIEDVEYGDTTPLFTLNNDLYFGDGPIVFKSKIYIYEKDQERFVPLQQHTEYYSPLQLGLYQTTLQGNDYDFIIQESGDGNLKVNNGYTLGKNDTNYITDKFYFDKENVGLAVNDYDSYNYKSPLISDQIAYSKTLSTNDTDIVMVLPRDCKIALYNKSINYLKTLKLRYNASADSSFTAYTTLNPEYQMFTKVFMGAGLENNDVYILVHGRFSNIIRDENDEYIETYADTPMLRMFHTTTYDIKNAFNDELNVTLLPPSIDIDLNNRNEIESYIREQNRVPSKSIDLTALNGRQLICMGKDILYNNVHSVVFWDSNSMSIDVVSPNNWNTTIDNDVLNMNQNDSYVDHYVAVNRGKEVSIIRKDSLTGMTKFKVDLDGDMGLAQRYSRVGKYTYISNSPLRKIETLSVPGENGATSWKLTASEPTINKDIISGIIGHTPFGALAVCTKTTGLVIIDPNTRNDLHYIIHPNGEIEIDTFTGNGNRYYNRIRTSRLGVFRFTLGSSSSNPIPSTEYSDLRPIYFTPKNSDKTIIINLGVNNYVTRIWDTYAGVFITFANKITTEAKLYRMKTILNGIQNVNINDTNYFEECNTNNGLPQTMIQSQHDLLLCTFGFDPNYGRRTILKWNGEDFYSISDGVFNPPTGQLNIFDSSIGVLILGTENNAQPYIYDGETIKPLVRDGYTWTTPGLMSILSGHEMGPVNNHAFETELGPTFVGSERVVSLLTPNQASYKQAVVSFDETGPGNNYPTLQQIRVYKDTTTTGSLKNTAKYLVNTMGLPVDTKLKAIGNILFNGLQVPISGLEIISENGESTKPLSVKFIIDRDARFARNPETLKEFFGPNYDIVRNVGVITDYDTDRKEYIRLPVRVSKMNFTVLYND